MKRIATIISNDHHLTDDNIDRKKGLIQQQCKLAKKLNVDNISFLGDLFDSRRFQSITVLNGISDIFNMIGMYGLTCHIIPGNHCKTLYNSDDSFLDSYKYHPNINIYKDVTKVNLNGLEVYFVPFWEDNILFDKLSKIEDNSFILSHFGTNESINNDGGLNKTIITVSFLRKFKKVMLGHFHDASQIGKNIFHLPSIEQNNFGENEDKGFTVLYDDGSHELIKSKFKSYKKIKIDLDSVTDDEIKGLKEEFKESKDNIRFEFTGSESKVKSINKQEFSDLGIQVKTKYKEIEQDIEYLDKEEVVEYNKDSIVDVFAEFCEAEDLNFETGVKYLNKKLNK